MTAKTDDFIEEADQPLLTKAEIDKIKAQARDEILAEKKANLRAKLLKEETQRLKTEEGLTTGNSYQDEIVNLTIDLPNFAPYLGINSQRYWHGKTYSVPRHVADTMLDQMARSWDHQLTIEGKSMKEKIAERHVADLYRVGKGTVLSGKAG